MIEMEQLGVDELHVISLKLKLKLKIFYNWIGMLPFAHCLNWP